MRWILFFLLLLGCTPSKPQSYATTQPMIYRVEEMRGINLMRDSVVKIHHLMYTLPTPANKLLSPSLERWAGSGVVIYCDGVYSYIITVNHLTVNLPNTDKHNIFVVPHDLSVGRILLTDKLKLATVLAESKFLDLALLKVKAVFPVTPLIDVPLPSVGSNIYSIGYPLDKGLKVTTGTISQYENEERGLLLRITSPIDHGNSGGGIYASDGRLIGIVQEYFTTIDSRGISSLDVIYWLNSTQYKFLIKKAD